MPIVSVQAAGRYDPKLLDRAVAAHFEALDVARDLGPTCMCFSSPTCWPRATPRWL